MPAKLEKIKTDSVKPNSIPASREVDTYKRLICDYGALLPPVIGDFEDGTKTLLCGDAELSAMIELEADYTESIVVPLKGQAEGDKLTLMLMDMKSPPDAITQGKLINSLICSLRYTQLEIAGLLHRSAGWVSKRLSLVTRLDPAVMEMVRKKTLPPLTAQEVARMPLEAQRGFSSKIAGCKIPKSSVEKLVSEYSRANCPEDFKAMILNDPVKAIGMLPGKSARQIKHMDGEPAVGALGLSPASADGGLDEAINKCSPALSAVYGLVCLAGPSTLLKHEKALKQMLADIDAITKKIAGEFYVINPPSGENNSSRNIPPGKDPGKANIPGGNAGENNISGGRGGGDQNQVCFDRFWESYPRKAGKGAARKAWGKIKPTAELHSRIIEAIAKQKKSSQWQRDNGQYIPNPSTWLNEGRWEDELPEMAVGAKASNSVRRDYSDEFYNKFVSNEFGKCAKNASNEIKVAAKP
jgi:hypothetical protein